MLTKLNHTKIMLLDDEQASVNLLRLLLNEFTFKKEVHSFTDSEQALNELFRLVPDILFLDIEMPGICGTEILEQIHKNQLHIHTVIIAADKSHIAEAARYGIMDYLLKPIDLHLLRETLNKYVIHKNHHKNNFAELNGRVVDKIHIPTSFADYFFGPDEISYLKADSNYTDIITTDGKKYTSSFHIGKIQESLPKQTFGRVSRSVIINLNQLKQIDRRKKVVIISDKEFEIPYSKTYLNKLLMPVP